MSMCRQTPLSAGAMEAGREGGRRFSGLGVTGSGETYGMSAENSILLLCKNSKHS